MRTDLATLYWLQTRLLRNALRRKNVQDTGRLVGVILLTLLFLPMIIGLSIGIIIAFYRLTEPLYILGGVTAGFTLVTLIWLASPASNQQLVEPLRISRLIPFPIDFTHLVVGSFLSNSFSFATAATVPLLVAVVIGAARSFGQAVMMFVGSALMLAVLLVLKAILDDLLELVAEDRRLRMAIVTLSILPFLLVYFGQFYISFGVEEGAGFENLDMATLSGYLSWLRWLPPAGWYATIIVGAQSGEWLSAFYGAMALLLLALVGFLLHVRLIRRLYFGELIKTGTGRIASRAELTDARSLLFLSPESSDYLQSLVRKDWLNFRRSPMTTRLTFLPIMLGLLSFFFTDVGDIPTAISGLGIAGFVAFMVTMMAHNQIATYDHKGVGALLLSPVPRRFILMSYAIINLGVAIMLALLGGTISAIRAGTISQLAIVVGVTILLQIPLNGLTHLSSLVFPYQVDLERGSATSDETRQSFFTVFSVFLGLPLLIGPIMLVFVLTLLLVPEWWLLAAVFAMVYGVGIYAALLTLAVRLFPRREEILAERIVGGR